MQMIMPLRRRRPVPVPAQLAPLFSAPFASSMRPQMPAMPTDISSSESELDLTMELPGFSKDDVTIELKDGYLVVSAEMKQEQQECSCEAPEGERAEAAEASAESASEPQASEQSAEQPAQKQSWVRRERFYGSCTRSFYVGDDIQEDAITAKFDNGLLKVHVPRKVEQPEPEQRKLIEIEG